MSLSCSHKMPLSLPCNNGTPQLPQEKHDISGVDHLGNVYDNARKIVGWWIKGPNKTIRAKMYETGIECSLKIDK